MKRNKEFGFNYKLELLKDEFAEINSIIDRIDKICQTTKYWTILIFFGVLSAILGSDDEEVKRFIILVPFIPLIFWILEASWRKYQNRAIYRVNKISDFLNSDDFDNSIKGKSFENFKVLDTMGNQYRELKDYKKFTSFWRCLWFKTTVRYYVGLIGFSILAIGLLRFDFI